ncbi:hypothetical protein CRUP_016409 [Coryphaenoides rupestris]|nr:hypothetical protein CRUP_016409 [Coryphaenoides rupestris]
MAWRCEAVAPGRLGLNRTVYSGAMQTPETGSGSASSAPLQTTVPGQPTGPSQQAQTVQQVQHVYPAQVQYVEETSGIYTNGTIRTYSYTEPQLYSQNSGGSYFDTQAGASQVPSVVVGMTNNNNNNNGDGGGGGGGGNGVMGMGLAGGQVIDGGSGAYLIDATTAPHASGQATRASPATIEMAIETLQKTEGLSSQRSSLLNSHKLDPVNAASFGKLIRSIFTGLRTRRLGTRLQDDMQFMQALRQQPVQQRQRFKPVQRGVEGGGSGGDGYTAGGAQHPTSATEQADIAQNQHHQDDHYSPDDVKTLESLYREHCEAILDVVINLQFSLIEKLWQTFWRYSPSDTVEGATITENSSCDYLMYQAVVEVLIPDVLRPIPSALTQAIRNFAKSLEGWLNHAMNAAPQRMVQTKVAAVSAFAQTLRRYTSLNHLAQAARAVLQNTSMVIRDLTLRSAASFGSFHLIRLLYDEYMFYLVEHRVARATGETAIGVMGEVASHEVSELDSDPDDDADEQPLTPLAKRLRPAVAAATHEVIQVIQVGAAEDGVHPVVGVVQPGVLQHHHALPQAPPTTPSTSSRPPPPPPPPAPRPPYATATPRGTPTSLCEGGGPWLPVSGCEDP